MAARERARPNSGSSKNAGATASGWSFKTPATPEAESAVTADAAVAPPTGSAHVEQSSTGEAEVNNATAARSSLEVVSLGLLLGVTLLYSVGWVFVAQAFTVLNESMLAASGTVGAAAQVALYWVASLAPILWMTLVHVLTQRRTVTRIALLSAGLVLLLPWPLFLAGGGA